MAYIRRMLHSEEWGIYAEQWDPPYLVGILPTEETAKVVLQDWKKKDDLAHREWLETLRRIPPYGRGFEQSIDEELILRLGGRLPTKP